MREEAGETELLPGSALSRKGLEFSLHLMAPGAHGAKGICVSGVKDTRPLFLLQRAAARLY